MMPSRWPAARSTVYWIFSVSSSILLLFVWLSQNGFGNLEVGSSNIAHLLRFPLLGPMIWSSIWDAWSIFWLGGEGWRKREVSSCVRGQEKKHHLARLDTIESGNEKKKRRAGVCVCVEGERKKDGRREGKKKSYVRVKRFPREPICVSMYRFVFPGFFFFFYCSFFLCFRSKGG